MVIETRSVPPFQKNGYVVACETTGEAIVIDPGDEVHALLEIIDSRSFAVQSILLTHAHIDHVTGVGPARKVLDVPVYLHRDDQFLYDAAPQQAVFFGVQCGELPPIDHYYGPDTQVSFGEYEVSVHHTPGHCPGGVCLAVGRRGMKKQDLFVGDTLFAGRSAAPICPEATTRRCFDRSHRCCFHSETTPECTRATARKPPSAPNAAPIRSCAERNEKRIPDPFFSLLPRHDELATADRKFVAILERRRFHPLAVDERAVGAAEILDLEGIGRGGQLAMQPGHEREIDDEFRTGRAAERFDGAGRQPELHLWAGGIVRFQNPHLF